MADGITSRKEFAAGVPSNNMMMTNRNGCQRALCVYSRALGGRYLPAYAPHYDHSVICSGV